MSYSVSFGFGGWLWRLLLAGGCLLAHNGYAQQHLSLWDTTTVSAPHNVFDIPFAIPLDESKPFSRLLINPTVNYHVVLVKPDASAPASGREALVAQLSLGLSSASMFSPQDTARRYELLLLPGVAHGALSLIGAHYIDSHIRLWAQGSVGLRLHNYRPDQTGSDYQFWQRYAGLGGGVAYRGTPGGGDKLALNVLWGYASADISQHTKEVFRQQFGPDRTASFIEVSARARVLRHLFGLGTGLYATFSWKRYYKDYNRPSLGLIGISWVLPNKYP